MDSKKFLQIVEEKKQKALEKKLARLEWEGRLEEAAMAPRRDDKRTQKKYKRKASSDSSVDPDTNKRSRSRRQRKRHSSSRSSEDVGFCRERHADRKPHGKHRRRDSSSDSSGSESDRSRKRYRRRKHKSSSHDLSDRSLDDEIEKRRRRRRDKKNGSDSDGSDSSDEERKFRRRDKQRETDSDDSNKSGGKRKHHGHKHKKHGKRYRGGHYKGGASSQEEDKLSGDGGFGHTDSKERWDLDRYRGYDAEEEIERMRSEHRLPPCNEPAKAKWKDSGPGENAPVTNGKPSLQLEEVARW